MSKKIFFFLLLILSILCEENKSTNEEPIEEPQFEEDDPFAKMVFPNVYNLDDSNYTSVLQKYDQAFVLLYATWCDHCHELMPIYNETANYFKQNNINVTFFKIDGSKNENASIDFVVMAFPRMFFINKGKRNKFQGPRTVEGFKYFYKRKLVDDIFEIQKLDDMKNIKNIFDTKLIMLSTIKNKTSKIYESLLEFADLCIFMDFVSCLSDECIQKYGEDIILFKTFDEKENSYKKDYGNLEDAKYDSVKDFASQYSIETGVFAKQHDINLWFEFDKKVIFYFRESDKEEDTQYDAFFKEMGYKLRKNNTYIFIASPDGNSIQSRIFNDLLILPEELPCIVYYDANSGDKISKNHIFKINKPKMKKVDEKYIYKFIRRIKEGKIRRDLYSELPLKEPKYIKGMKYVIGRDFDKEVTDVKDKNVVLILYNNVRDNYELEYLDVMGNITEKYKNHPEKKLKFTILNYHLNEPRDIDINEDYSFPKAYLYTNAMKEQKLIKFNQKNETEISIEEFDNFLRDKLKWDSEVEQNKEKEEIKNDKEKTKKEKNKKEPKNEDL
jgi:hypothetical protein